MDNLKIHGSSVGEKRARFVGLQKTIFRRMRRIRHEFPRDRRAFRCLNKEIKDETGGTFHQRITLFCEKFRIAAEEIMLPHMLT